jgi:hypothetical protein
MALACLLAFVGLSIILQLIRIQTSPEAATFRAWAKLNEETLQTYYPRTRPDL